MDEYPSSCVSVEDVERIADELVRDFDGTCLLIANEIVSGLDSVPLFEIVKHIGSKRESGDNDEDEDHESGGHRWLPDDLFERFETDFMPQIVQLVMRRHFDRECVKPANSFLQFMLEKVKVKLLTGDPCLLHSLIHILDEQGQFYAYHGTSVTEEDDDADDGSGEAERSASRESEKQQFAVVEKNPYVSVYFLRNLQFWGEIGGFSLFLTSLHSTSSEGEGENSSEDDTILSFEVIRCIFRTLYTVKDHLTSHFLLQYFHPFCDGLRFFMGKLSSAEFHSLSRESLLEVVQVMELVLVKVLQIQDQRLLECEDGVEEEEESTRDVLKQSVQLLRLEILLRQFRSSSLEKRIYGLSEIVTLITLPGDMAARKGDHGRAVWEKLHAELIKRSVPLFQFVSELECFDPKWLDLVWNCYGGTSSSLQQAHPLQQRHEAHRTTVQDLLMELVEFVDEPLLHHLFRKCQSILAIGAGQLSLLAVIAVRSSTTAEETGSMASTRGDSDLREQVLMHLWTAVIPTVTSDALVDQILQRMEDIIRKDASEKEVSRENPSEEVGDRSSTARPSIAPDLTERFCRACVDHVRRRQQIRVSLNLFTRLALLVAEMKWDMPALTTPGENSIAVILLNELRDYKTAVPVQVASNSAPHSLKPKEDASISHQSTVQLNEIKVRLLALRAAWIMESTIRSGSSSFSLSRAQLDLVWQLLIEKAATTDEASLCFEWIELCMNTPVSVSDDDNSESGTSSSLLSPQLVEHLLIHKFSSLSGDRVTLSTLCCFHRLFRYANLRNGGLQIFAAQSSDDGECAPADSDSVVDLTTGEPLIGLEQLWHLAVKSTKPEVAEECITLLASFYLEFVPDLQGAEITLQKKLEFVEMCMGFLTSAKAEVDQISKMTEGCSSEEGTAESVAIVNRCVNLLHYFMDACDAALDVPDASTRHRSSDASDRVSSGEVLGLRGYSLGESKLQRKVFELENLEERLQHLEIYPSPMKDTQQLTSAGQAELILNSSRRPSWTFRQNHALLDAIPDEDENEVSEGNDVLSRWRKAPMQDSNEEPLLVSPGTNTQDNRHFSSEEMLVSPRGSSLLPSKSAMRSPTVRIRPNLQWPQDVSPQRGPDLSLADISKALQEVDCEVDEESRARTIDSQAKSSSASPSSKKPKYSLMSQILANEDTYFDTLLQLVDWNDATSQRTWELICRLPTNNELLRKMIRLRPSNVGASEDVVWIDLLNTINIHRLLYALRLVEALLLPVENATGEAGVDQTSDSARRQWRERFVRLGGAKHLYEMLLRWELVHLAGQSDASGVSFVSAYTSNLTATCLAAVVRTLSYFVQLFRKAPREKQIGAEACSFDVRLTLATLPAFMRSISLKSLGESAVRLSFAYSSCKHESPSCRGTDTGKNTCISTQTEEAIQCGVQLFTVVVSLNPDLLIGGLWDPPIDSKESSMRTKRQSSPSLMEWIKSMLLDCPSLAARSMALRSLIELTTEARICKSKSLFVEELMRGLSDTLLNFSNETGQLQLFALLDSLLSSSAPRLEISPRQSVVSWLFENSIPQRVLTKLHEYVTHAKNTDEEFICGYLEILRSLVLLSDKLRESALSYHPENELKGEDPSSASYWTVNLLLKYLLFGSLGSAADSNADHDFIMPKCKSDRSRELAQMLLSTLVAPAREALLSGPTTSANHVLKSHDAFQKSVLATLRARGRPWNFSPRDLLQDWENEIYHTGLVNPGCICYMNALVQQLFMTPSFREGLLSVDCMFTVPSSSSQWSDEIAELQKLFVSLAFTNFRSFDPTAFALSHQDLDGNPTDLRVQMDADEFFCLLLDRIDTNLQSAAQQLHHEDASSNISSQGASNFLEKCFGGVLVNQIITEQGHVSEREVLCAEPRGVEEAASEGFAGSQKVSATKRICIKKLPQTLVCHLKRFEFDFDTMKKLKINDYLEFPQAIDMFPFTSEALSPSQEQLPHNSEGEQDTGNEGGSSTMYDLVGIVVHSGTSDMGHYYSFIKDRAHPERWLEFNDEVVREFEIDMIGDECFGGEEIKQVWDGNARVNKVQMKRRNAYMLMYERRAEPVAFSVGEQEGVIEMSKASQLSHGSVNSPLRALIKETCQENAQFQSVVDVFGSTYSQFMKMVVDQAFSSSCDSSAKSSIGGNTLQDWDGVVADLPCGFVRLQACVLGCQYLFGMASLQSSSTDHASLHSQNDLLKQIVDWLTTEDLKTVDADDTEKCAFSAWLLRQAIASPSQENVSVARSWIFDVVFLNESNPDLVDGCLDILSASVLILTRQLSSKDKHCGKDNNCHRTAIVDFYRVLLDLFHDREQTVELADPTSDGVMTLSTTTVVSALSRIGVLLENCVCVKFADSAEERDTTHQIFIRDLQYFD